MHLKTPTKMRTWSSLRLTLFVQVALLVTLTVFLMVVTAFLLAGIEIRRNAFDQLRSLVTGHESLIETILTKQREQVSIVAERQDGAASDTIQKLLGFESLLSVTGTGEITLLNGADPSKDVLAEIEAYEGHDATILIPVITSEGFARYIIMTPRGGGHGNLAAVFDARILFSTLFKGAEQAEQVSLVLTHKGEVLLFTTDQESISPSMIYVGKNDDADAQLAERAARGEELEEQVRDYANIRVFAVVRTIPSVGWGLIATVDRYQTYIPIWRLALTMFGGGLAIILLSIVIVGSMANRITAPLHQLKKKLSNLQTKEWKFERTIFTGNELEVVDQAAFDLTTRLKESYEHLEERVRERTQEVLEKNAQDDAIFTSLQYGLLVTNREGKVILLNDAASTLTGWAPDLARTVPYAEILKLFDKEHRSIQGELHPMQIALIKNQTFAPVIDPGYTVEQKNGKSAPIFITTAPIMKNGECLGAIALFRDVTEDRRIDQMKSQFISLASHQLRTPLSSIRWYVEMLLGGDEGALDNEKQKSVEEIGAANDRMIRMVTSLLHVANLELGTFTVHDEAPVDITELIRKIEAMFIFECKTRSIKLHEEFETSGTVMKRTDPELLGLILQNIISNAIKYSHDGGDVVVRMNDKNGTLAITIEDHGIGIPKKDQTKIFEKLFRADNAREVDTDGNGLGLYIAKIAADALKTKIEVTSEEGKGTTFTLTL